MHKVNSTHDHRQALSAGSDNCEGVAIVHRNRKENEYLANCATDSQCVYLIENLLTLKVLQSGLIAINLNSVCIKDKVPDYTAAG